MSYLEDIRQKRLEELSKADKERSVQRQVDAVVSGTKAIERTVITQSSRGRKTNQPVEIKNIDEVASGEDIELLAKTVDDLLMSTSVDAMESTEKLEEICDSLEVIASSLEELPREYDQSEVVKELESVVKALSKLPTSFPKPEKLGPTLNKLIESLEAKDFSPTIELRPPEVVLPAVDLSGIEKQISALKKSLPKSPDISIDLSSLQDGLAAVKEAITSQVFPVPNYVLPFKDTDGKATQVQLDSNGALPMSGGSGGSSYSKPTDEYDLVQDDDTSSASYEYYGYMKSDEAWYIKRITLSTNLREYVKGTSGYTTAWTNRSTQTYGTYGATF